MPSCHHFSLIPHDWYDNKLEEENFLKVLLYVAPRPFSVGIMSS